MHKKNNRNPVMRITVGPAIALVLVSTLPAQSEAAGIDFGGDLRTGVFGRDRDDRDGSSDSNDELRLRLRPGVGIQFSNKVSGKVRFAGRYSTDESNDNHFEFFEAIPASDGLRRGDSTLDELYLRFQPSDRWDVKVGRMQTKFELEGVAKKSLSRNDSPNTDITWTDGLYGKYKAASGWNYHVILQRSTDEGPTTVRRKPLAFTEDGSHVTYYFGLERKDKKAKIVQRGLDITYIPRSLRKDGTATGRIEDYYGITGRLAVQWPVGSGPTKLMWAGEAGYAPNTPTEAAIGIGGADDTSGLAFQTSINFVDIKPHHSIGLLYAHGRGGWLLSPDIGNNQHLLEGRYKWQVAKKHRIEARLRKREDYTKRTTAVRKRTGLDYYVRYTFKY